MTILFRRIKPSTFPITLDLIAKFLGIPESMLIRAVCVREASRREAWCVSSKRWAYVLFVHRCDKGGQFISYRKLELWIEAVVSIIQKSATFDDLWQVGLWIRQECEKFDYEKPVLEYLRRVWAKHSRLSQRLAIRKRCYSLSGCRCLE
jgi:hypothetical protein